MKRNIVRVVAVAVLIWVAPFCTSASVLVEDGCDGASGAPPEAAKFEWSGEVAQNGAGQLSLQTWAVNLSWLRSKAAAEPGEGQTLVLQLRAYAYAEDWGICGNAQPRGLRVGSDANNAAEFYSLARTSVGMRVRRDGAESSAAYALPSGVDAMHDYEISVTPTSVCFKVDGELAGTFTTNLPTGPLNAFVSTDDGGGGNVPVTLDSLLLSLAGGPPVVVPYTCATNDGTITLTRYTGSDGMVVIPSAIEDVPVTAIGINAFNSTSITNVIIPSSVTRIENWAFSSCGQLASLTIGRGVTNLGYRVFDSCASLAAITVDDLNPVFSSREGVMFNKDQTTLIQYPAARVGSYAVPIGVTHIGDEAFLHCPSLTGVLLPDSVTEIGGSTFYGCTSLSSVTIPDSVTHLGHHALAFCTGLTNAVVGDGVPSLDGTFSDCPNLVSVTLGTSVTNLDEAFVRCANLPGVVIPESVTCIGHMAFAGCTRLGNITIPSRVTLIGDSAFSACSSMTRFTIPDSVTTIGNYAFHYCTSLTGGTIGNGVTTLGHSAFKNCSAMTDIVIPSGVTSIGDNTFADCTSLFSVTIPNCVTAIGTGAFSACRSLTGITIPQTVTSIGGWAFDGCASLTNVYCRGNAPSDGPCLFNNATNATIYCAPGTTGWGTLFAGQPVVAWNPQVQTCDASFGVGTNGFGFTVTVTNNLVIVIEACTNLANPIWCPLQTNTPSGGSLYFSDPQWANHPGRFYRLRSL